MRWGGGSRRGINSFTGVVVKFSGNRGFLVIICDGFDKYMTSNQLTIMTIYSIHVTKETRVLPISTKPEEAANLEKVY